MKPGTTEVVAGLRLSARCVSRRESVSEPLHEVPRTHLLT